MPWECSRRGPYDPEMRVGLRAAAGGVVKTALVTGGTTRLGAAIAARLRADGWRVRTSSHRPDAGADFVADLSRAGAADALFAAAGPLEALVNNAALFRGAPEMLAAVNLAAPVRLMDLMAARGGTVVNILDTRVLGAAPLADDYARTKTALRDETLRAARASRPGFRVNAVAPGPVLAPVGAHERAGALLTARPTPEDVAAAVAFLLAAPSITGCILPVDGGQHLLRKG